MEHTAPPILVHREPSVSRILLYMLPMLLRPALLRAQDSAIVSTVVRVEDSLHSSKGKTLRIGLSLGLRYITDKADAGIRLIAIDPVDTTVRANGLELGDLTLSGVVVAFPWKPRAKASAGSAGAPLEWGCSGWCRWGFIANVNIATISPQNTGVFNKSIEGGVGIAYRLADDFSLAATYERVFGRRIRNIGWIGQKLVVDGKTLTSLDQNDDRFFVDDALSAISVKFVYFLN
jgi:hypothetical protein